MNPIAREGFDQARLVFRAAVAELTEQELDLDIADEIARYRAQTDPGDTSPIPTPEPHPDDVPDGDIAITEAQPEPVDDDGTQDTEEPDHA